MVSSARQQENGSCRCCQNTDRRCGQQPVYHFPLRGFAQHEGNKLLHHSVKKLDGYGDAVFPPDIVNIIGQFFRKSEIFVHDRNDVLVAFQRARNFLPHPVPVIHTPVQRVRRKDQNKILAVPDHVDQFLIERAVSEAVGIKKNRIPFGGQNVPQMLGRFSPSVSPVADENIILLFSHGTPHAGAAPLLQGGQSGPQYLLINNPCVCFHVFLFMIYNSPFKQNILPDSLSGTYIKRS